MQRRFNSFADHLTQNALISSHVAVLRAGPYAGLDFTPVGPDRFVLTPGSVLMPSGTIVSEDENVQFDPLFPLPSPATTYTIKIAHNDVRLIGGEPATYSIVAGLSPAQPNEIILGYVLYPGSGVALASNMWRPTPRLRSDLLSLSTIDYASLVMPPTDVLVSLGGHSLTSLVLDSPRINRRFTADGTTPIMGDVNVVNFQWIARRVRPRRVAVTVQMPSTCTMTVAIVDTSGTLVALGTVAGTGARSTHSFSVPVTGSAYDSNLPALVRVTLTLTALQQADLGIVEVVHDPLI